MDEPTTPPDAACGIPGCSRKYRCSGLCGLHYERYRRHGDPEWQPKSHPDACSIPGCGKPVVGRGWCRKHYVRWSRHGDPEYAGAARARQCAADGCDEPPHCQGFCRPHYQRWRKYGDAARIPVTGRPPTHAMTGTGTYRSWLAMRVRCTDPKHHAWKNYGGRGITVCDRWMESFENFYADMGDRPSGRSLDRVDNDGNYEPGNCRWATRSEQARNKRRTA